MFAGAGGEEVKFFASAGAEHVEETLALGIFAGFFGGVQPLVELVGVSAFAPDGSKDDGRGVSGCAIDFEPVEKVGGGCAGLTFKAWNEHDIPFEAFGFVDGEEFNGDVA